MSLITRYLPPDAKGFKLTFSEMDNNLYYLQSLGVSGLTYSANTLTITNPTGGTKSVKIVENNNRWYIPSGETITIDSFYQSFIYGDVVVEGTLDIKENAQLVVLNGDLISSGGTIVQSGDTYLIDLPLVDTSIDSFVYSDNTFTITDSTGGTFSTVLNVVTGLTVNGDLTVNGTSKSNIFSGTTISADTIYPKVIDLCENNGTLYTDTISGCSPINILSETYFQVGLSATTISGSTFYGDASNLIGVNFTGGTVSGETTFEGGLSATTISGDTFYGDGSNLTNVGGEFTGGTVTGNTLFSGGLTTTNFSANTISTPQITTYSNNFITPSGDTSSISTGSFPIKVYVDGVYAYVTNSGSDNLLIYDYTTPNSPSQIANVSLFSGSFPYNVIVSGNYAYINGAGSTLEIFDISTPSSPSSSSLTFLTGFTYLGLSIQGNYAYLAGNDSSSVEVYNISNPSSPSPVSSLLVTQPRSIVTQGNYAYVTKTNTFDVIDISNPLSLSVVGTCSIDLLSDGLFVSGNYVYVVSQNLNTLKIIDISTPSSPTVLSTTSTDTTPFAVTVSNNYAFVVNQTSNTLQVFDVSNPSSPQEISSVSTGDGPNDVFIEQNYVYVLNTNDSTLQNFEFQFPSSLVEITNLSATTISGGTLYGDGSNLVGISTQDTFVTGGTYSNGTAIFTNNTGGTFNVTGFFTGGTTYKVYTVLITQSGINNPTVTVLENTLGYTPSLSRNLAGQYEIGVTGTTIPMYSITENTTNINYVFRMTPSFNMGIYTIAIKTYDSGVATDGLLSNTPIEIKVYN
jgi:hypothetical protein